MPRPGWLEGLSGSLQNLRFIANGHHRGDKLLLVGTVVFDQSLIFLGHNGHRIDARHRLKGLLDMGGSRPAIQPFDMNTCFHDVKISTGPRPVLSWRLASAPAIPELPLRMRLAGACGRVESDAQSVDGSFVCMPLHG